MKEITITIYKNRHMRASQLDLNDMRGGRYISQKAIRALQRVGVKFKFMKLIQTLEDVTETYQKRIAEADFAKRTTKQPRRAEFDPFSRVRA